MDNNTLDELQRAYRQAVDQWVNAIRAQQALANADHSEIEMEKWDAAGFTVEDAQARAKHARDAYQDALRKLNYKF